MNIKIGSSYGKSFEVSGASEIKIVEDGKYHKSVYIKKGDNTIIYGLSAEHHVIKLDREHEEHYGEEEETEG